MKFTLTLMLSLLTVSVSGKKAIKISGGFDKMRRCDSCLVLAQEFVNVCSRVKPPKMMAEVWAGELMESGLSRAVTKWTWSQPRGYDKGRYKTNEELMVQYKDSPDAQRMLKDAMKKPPEKKDTMRFNFLSQIINEVDEDLERVLGKCSEENRSYDAFSRFLCKYTCDEERLGGEQYPDPAIVQHLKEIAAQLNEEQEGTDDGWYVGGKKDGDEAKTQQEDKKEAASEEL
eukprot:TRINITY_DN4505_c0_g1_i1.p1 TRINITY_DN4505_c0_g1~~TRINITY_DN4505_c0_g1_i1.p1  ORF type:complete len:243 (+),score=61.12 TRINITY_DN4505_c0_g1_i1:40-729(+)